MPTFAAMSAGYRSLWAKAKVRSESQGAAEKAAKSIIANKARYQAVERKTGVPWFWIGATHYRESTFDWSKSLAQGDPWDKKSVRIPRGRGPFPSWEAAAIDALVTLKKLDKVRPWSIDQMLYEFERYNGFGYVGRGVNSPYLWAGTTLQQPGKYVADKVWSSIAWDKQLGCACILKALCVLDGTVAEFIGRDGDVPMVVDPIEPVKPAKDPKVIVGTATGVATGVGFLSWLLSHVLPLLVGVAVAAVVAAIVGYAIYRLMKKEE
jgi:lysozyme family protein